MSCRIATRSISGGLWAFADVREPLWLAKTGHPQTCPNVLRISRGQVVAGSNLVSPQESMQVDGLSVILDRPGCGTTRGYAQQQVQQRHRWPSTATRHTAHHRIRGNADFAFHNCIIRCRLSMESWTMPDVVTNSRQLRDRT